MKLLKKLIFTLTLFLTVCGSLYANHSVDMADSLRESGKIYVVVLVVLIIFAGIIGFLVNLDRKIAKIEEEVNSKA